MRKISLLILLSPVLANAQQTSFFEQFKWELIIGLILLVGIVTILALLVVWSALRAIVRERRTEQGLAADESLIQAREGEESIGFWGRFWNRFNSATPVALEASVDTGHEYDGIKELDNRLPPWWLYGFYFTIIFGVIYFIHFEVFGSGMTQDEEFQAQMVQADKDIKAYKASMQTEGGEVILALSTDAADLSAGMGTFKAYCASCHAQDGGGMMGLGPNLTDKYWKNGKGQFEDIANIIQKGVTGTSMIAWESQLAPEKIGQVASYVYSLEGTTPANPKEAEGELYERTAAMEEATVETDTTSVSGTEQ